MNSLLATPPVPPHEQSRLSSRPMSSLSLNPSSSRKRKAEDESIPSDHDARMSASPSSSPVLSVRPTRQIKRSRPNMFSRSLSLPRLLQTLGPEELRSVLHRLCELNPDLEHQIKAFSPRPSLDSTVRILRNYASDLESAIPLGSRTSDYAYNRVRGHVTDLFTAVNDFTFHFLPPSESQTATSLDYLDNATEIINGVPRWTSPQYNLESDTIYEEISKAWILVIREAEKKGGGIHLRLGGWDQKLARHNHHSGGKLQDAMNELASRIGWMGTHQQTDSSSSNSDPSIYQQLFTNTYGVGLPLKIGHW